MPLNNVRILDHTTSFLSVSQTFASIQLHISITFVWCLSPYNTASRIKQLMLDFSYKNRPHSRGESRPVWRLSLKAFGFGFPKRMLCFIYISYFLSECSLTFSSGEKRECKVWVKGAVICQLLPGGDQPCADALCLQPSFSSMLYLETLGSACPWGFFKLPIAPHVPFIARALFQIPLLYLQD